MIPPTLADVAAACDVSMSTVSRAFVHPDKVSERTLDRILRATRDMGYAHPGSTPARTRLIGIIAPDIANPCFPPIIKAIQNRASRNSQAVVLVDTDEHAGDEIRMASVISAQVDGLIMISPRAPAEELRRCTNVKPVVFINRRISGSSCVVIEGDAGFIQAVDHLAALGHANIAYVAGPRDSWANEQRQKAISDACHARGLQLQVLGPYEPQMQSGVLAADRIGSSGATAIIAYNDLMALGVMTRVGERGLRVGVDVSVVGIDDSNLSHVTYPPLTSVHLAGVRAGSIAVDLLTDEITQRTTPKEIIDLDTRLMVRSSTGPVPERDPDDFPA